MNVAPAASATPTTSTGTLQRRGEFADQNASQAPSRSCRSGCRAAGAASRAVAIPSRMTADAAALTGTAAAAGEVTTVAVTAAAEATAVPASSPRRDNETDGDDMVRLSPTA
ncbi:hypothetical protein Vse01_23740 [Micromonospora sediminimaris]|uniref:Uncharacterized protein n=1 Tax=Micromonospora sediminimaris TaxID=547162 RepID=A0A9W5UQJ9_9ACTN|nr:hypothetical protein Vse01_23740 [Micromonospora sediminimaris]